MTTRRRKGQSLALLQAALFTGSLLASVLGTRLLAKQDTAQTAAAAPEPIVVTVPLDSAPAQRSAPNNARPASGDAQLLSLPPVPTAVAPVMRPITRTRSSR